MIYMLIRLEFEDGYFREVHTIAYEYENDFDCLIHEHGDIIHVFVSAVPVNGEDHE